MRMRFRQLILCSPSLVFVFSSLTDLKVFWIGVRFFQYLMHYSVPVCCTPGNAVRIIKPTLVVTACAWRSRGMPLHAIWPREVKSIFTSEFEVSEFETRTADELSAKLDFAR